MDKPEPEHQHELDTCGLMCPEPIMMLHQQIRRCQTGDIIKLIATDPATQRDVPQFCEFLPHQLINTATISAKYVYWIKKGSG